MREVPYYTTDDEGEYCGHVWKQRSGAGGPWGFAWEVLAPHDDDPVAEGWRATQPAAERAMNEALERYSK